MLGRIMSRDRAERMAFGFRTGMFSCSLDTGFIALLGFEDNILALRLNERNKIHVMRSVPS